MQSIKQFFDYMNDVNFNYVVLRNWDNLPDDVQLGEHSDLDLLVYDLEHWMEIFPDAKRVYPAPRVQFKVPIKDSFIQVDVRHIGDRYYPKAFQETMLEAGEWNPKGFFTPPAPMFRLALAYHVVHHKNAMSPEYSRWIGNVSVEELLEALKLSSIGWVDPTDPTVGKFNQYFKGATAVVEKKDGKVVKRQTSYADYDRMEKESKILSTIKGEHFPRLLKSEGDTIEIEDCGDPLTVDNLPDNWKAQLIQVIIDLRTCKVEHRDIRPNNLMVKDGVIKLIDFGWAHFKEDPSDNPPECLGYPYKASWGWDDNFSMTKVIKEFEYQQEESYAHIRS